MVSIRVNFGLPWLLSLAVFFLAITAIMSDACHAQTGMSADQIRQSIVTAGNEYRAGKIDEAVKLLHQSTADLQKLAIEADSAKVVANLKVLHGGLAKAYQRLELDGVALDPLPAWKQILEQAAERKKSSAKTTANTPANGDAISFTADVAPWLVAKCSRCHINDAKGGFSMKTLNDLMKGSKAGKVLFPKDAESSTLVDIIESGDMPRGGGKVTAAELDQLKKWINQGCVFDAKDATAPLTTLAAKTGKPIEPRNRDVTAMIAKPTGKETVSFSRDVAPLLLGSCKGCHIDADRLGGELNMDAFVGLMRGGESGAVIQPNKAEQSLLIQKLRGTSGDRMPAGGRPALKSEEIQLISKWIDEGATFDGYSPNAGIEAVASRAWASAATHEELMKKRKERALEMWNKVFPSQKPDEAMGGEFVVLGNVGQRGVEEILSSTRTAMEKIRKALKTDDQDSLAKGGVTIFAIKSRYDYSEFGKMAESRTLPNQWTGHWRREVLDVYVTVLYDAKDAKANESNLTQQLASLWISSNQGTPSWFANGFGRAVFAMIAGRNEAKVKNWDQQIPAIVGSMKSPKELLDEKMNEEDAAIVGYGLVRKMIDSSNRRPFDQFLRSLDRTQDFEQSFAAPIEQTVGVILGLQPMKKRK